MVGCLKTCGLLLCALLTALHVDCVVHENNDYQCHEGKPDGKREALLVKCDRAFYRLSLSFSEEVRKEDNKAFLDKYQDVTIEYHIKILDQQRAASSVTSSPFEGIPVKGRPLEFITDHVPDIYRIELTLKLTGNDTTEYKPAVESEMALTTPRYPRCLVFVTNSANPDVIYGGCIKEMGFPFGSSVFRYKKLVRDISIVVCPEECVIFPEFTKTQVTCPVPENDPKPSCQKSVIEIAEKSPHFDMAKKLQPLPTTTTEPNSTTQNESTTTQSTTTTSSPVPTSATCKPGPGTPIGFIVGMSVAIVLLLVAVVVIILQKLQARKLSAEYDQRGVAVKAWELENVRLNKEIDVLRPLCGLEDPIEDK